MTRSPARSPATSPVRSINLKGTRSPASSPPSSPKRPTRDRVAHGAGVREAAVEPSPVAQSAISPLSTTAKQHITAAEPLKASNSSSTMSTLKDADPITTATVTTSTTPTTPSPITGTSSSPTLDPQEEKYSSFRSFSHNRRASMLSNLCKTNLGVTRLKFGRDSPYSLAWASQDKTLSVANLSEPNQPHFVFKGTETLVFLILGQAIKSRLQT